MKRTSSLPGLLIILVLLLSACGKSGSAVSTVGTGEAPGSPGATATPTPGTDLSSLSYTQAFDEMFAVIRRDYAFNGVAGKEPDWEALYAEIRPRVEHGGAGWRCAGVLPCIARVSRWRSGTGM